MNVQLHPRREQLRARAMHDAVAGPMRVAIQQQRHAAIHRTNTIENYNNANAFYIAGGKHIGDN
jgi:hypothetical protein